MELTRKEIGNRHFLFSKYDISHYKMLGKEFDSRLFEFTCDNFKKPRKHYFCYAGDWTMVLNLATGDASGCYCDYRVQNIYADLNKPIIFRPIGNNCSGYCHNGQHFLAWGAIPELDKDTYGSLRNRKDAHWQNKDFEEFANHFLFEGNKEYNSIEKMYYNFLYIIQKFR